MGKFSKIAATVAACAAIASSLCFSGCIVGENGADGKDGKDFNIYEVYEAVNDEREKSGLEELAFLDFVKEYLGYDGGQVSDIASTQAAMNRSLLAGVAIRAVFKEYTDSYPIYGGGYRTKESTYAGSGVIIDIDKTKGDMTVVTNCHVVYSSSGVDDGYCDDIGLWTYGTEPTDTYASAEYKIPAKIIGAVKQYDIAVLKVTDSEIVRNSNALAASWVDSDSVFVGESVYAVGNPEGYGLSVTEGIISRDSEEIMLDIENTTTTADDTFYRVLRTDAAINGGNSGGALYNADGKIVGIINSKSISDDSGTPVDGMSYALPAATVRRVVKNILDNYSGTETHAIKKAMLGITTTVSSVSVAANKSGFVEIYETVKVAETVQQTAKVYGVLAKGDILKRLTIKDESGAVVEDLDITRSYSATEAMLSVRVGYSVTVVYESSGLEKEATFNYTAADFTKID